MFDLGSSQSRIGLSGDDAPFGVVQSVVARSLPHPSDPNHSSFQNSDRRGVQLLPMNHRQHPFSSITTTTMMRMMEQQLLEMEYPIERGVVTHWDSIELFVEHFIHLLSERLHQPPSNNYYCSEEEASTSMRILFTEPPLNPIENRLEYLILLFERFQVQAAQSQLSPILSVYTSGRCSAMCIESGDGITSIMKDTQCQVVSNDWIWEEEMLQMNC